MNPQKNFYFDLDGVLVDACDWHYLSFNRSLVNNNELEIPHETHLRVFNGLPSRVKLEILGVERLKRDSIIEDKNTFFEQMVELNCSPDYSKIELISFLKSQGSKVACVTNSIRRTAELMLKKIGVYDSFNLIVSNEVVTENKPSPFPYNFAINSLNASGQLNIAVEDSEKGVEAASKSKVNLVWKVNDATEVNLANYKSIFGG